MQTAGNTWITEQRNLTSPTSYAGAMEFCDGHCHVMVRTSFLAHNGISSSLTGRPALLFYVNSSLSHNAYVHTRAHHHFKSVFIEAGISRAPCDHVGRNELGRCEGDNRSIPPQHALRDPCVCQVCTDFLTLVAMGKHCRLLTRHSELEAYRSLCLPLLCLVKLGPVAMAVNGISAPCFLNLLRTQLRGELISRFLNRSWLLAWPGIRPP